MTLVALLIAVHEAIVCAPMHAFGLGWQIIAILFGVEAAEDLEPGAGGAIGTRLGVSETSVVSRGN